MKKIDLEAERKDIIGDLDRLLISIGMAIISLFPTYFYLIFRPKLLCSMLLGAEVDGRERLKLGPGITFILTIGVLLIVGYVVKDIAAQNITPESSETARKGIRGSLSEGNIWRSVILSLPFYLSALAVGLIFHLSHMLFKKTSNLSQAVGIGLYVVSTILLLIAGIGMTSENLGGSETSLIISGILIVTLAFLVLPWQFYSFSRHAFGNSRGAALGISIFVFITIWFAFALVAVVGSQISGPPQ